MATSESRLKGPQQGGAALEAMHRFMLWLSPTVNKFPRSQKFVLGDRIEGIALDVLERLIEATYTRGREALLAQANLGVEKLHNLDLRRYEHAARAR